MSQQVHTCATCICIAAVNAPYGRIVELSRGQFQVYRRRYDDGAETLESQCTTCGALSEVLKPDDPDDYASRAIAGWNVRNRPMYG